MAKLELSMTEAVTIKNLSKRYGEISAVNDVSLSILDGEIFGILGPNGAGKTTMIEIIEGLREQDSGEVYVLGMDPRKGRKELKDVVGVQLQSTSFYKKLKVSEVVKQFAAYYSHHLDVDGLLNSLSLEEKKNNMIEDLSGGQRQRLTILLALINDPKVIFLDEPTRDLDPRGRRQIWKIIEKAREDKKTLILTTHYIEEAEKLCDRVAIMDSGRIIALDTPVNLVAASNAQIRFGVASKENFDCTELKKLSPIIDCVKKDVEYTLWVDNVEAAIVELVKYLQEKNNTFSYLHVSRATLEDVFIKMTGKGIDE
jgi:ABC-2 type transport system ATP-binding protein